MLLAESIIKINKNIIALDVNKKGDLFMDGFKLSWRISSWIFANEENWKDFLNLIDRHSDVADEIAMYITDDIFPSLSPLDDKRKQVEIFKKCSEQLRQRGCKVGINVWPSFNLYPVERSYFPKMRRMVSINGKAVDDLACPVSDEFLDYMRKKYTIFAKGKPDFIWVDDDCRFTHMGGEYPCFCEGCVKGFKNGAFGSREELVEKLNDPANRELRIEWCEYGADRLVKFCEVIREAVDKVDPDIDLGLMTVGATHTTFAGNYINKCMKALRSRRGRPGHDLYSDRNLDKLMWKSLEVGRQVLEYPETTTDILWEEDSHPQGHLVKSFKTRQNEVSLALMAGCTGVAFNHMAMNGNSDERLGREVDELHNLRPRWEKFLEFAKDLKWCGMWPLHSWLLTAKAKPEYAWLKENPFGDEVYNACDISLPGKIGAFGVALTTDYKNSSATLLSGKTLTALEPEELKAVFSGNVYMDASALAALEELGLSRWAGVKINPTDYQNKPCIMTEHSFNDNFKNHAYRVTHGMKTHTLIPLEDGVEWLGYRANVFGEGDLCYVSKYQNELGGKVIVNAYDAWEYTDTPANLNLFSSIAKWFDSPLYLKWKNPHIVSRVQPYIRCDGKKAAVMLLNASLDTTNPFEIAVKGEMTKAVLVNSDGSETTLNCRREDDRLYVDIPTVNAWDIAFVLLK